MISANKLIGWFQIMYRQKWRYKWGSAKEGEVDCSGAFAYAYAKLGHRIPQGSNAIARGYVEQVEPISAAKPGYAAFKIREPGHPKYALPEKYRKGGSAYNGDLNDYYHIGLVDEDGKHVLNAQGVDAGFTRTPLSKWGAVGRLNAVNYGNPDKKEEKPMQTMIVTAQNGKPVRVRKNPSTDAAVVTELKVGTAVEAGDDVAGWREVVFGDEGGYMMAQFLAPVPDAATATDLPGDAPDPVQAYVRTLTPAEYSELCLMRDRMERDLEFIKSIVGVG